MQQEGGQTAVTHLWVLIRPAEHGAASLTLGSVCRCLVPFHGWLNPTPSACLFRVVFVDCVPLDLLCNTYKRFKETGGRLERAIKLPDWWRQTHRVQKTEGKTSWTGRNPRVRNNHVLLIKPTSSKHQSVWATLLAQRFVVVSVVCLLHAKRPAENPTSYPCATCTYFWDIWL